MKVHEELAHALTRLEATLSRNAVWNMPMPEVAAFESQQPFCLDTMTLPQWLRYVFIARLRALIDARAVLPASCDVAPAVEVWLREVTLEEPMALVRDIERVDRIVTRD